VRDESVEAATTGGATGRLETPRAAGVSGLVFSVLFVASVLLLRRRPATGSNAEEIADFYLRQDASRVALFGLYLAPFAGIAFLWFIAALRSHLGEREDRFFSTVFLGSGLLFVTMLFAASAAAGALQAEVRVQDQAPGTDAVLLGRALGHAFLFVFAVRAGAVFMLVVSTIGLRTRFLPRWLVFAGYATGIVFLVTVTYVELLVLVFPAWVVAVSVVILRTGMARGSA
jgi:hypothetical protein